MIDAGDGTDGDRKTESKKISGEEVVITDESKKLPGYAKGFAIIGFLEASGYDFFSEFGMYFLTSIARMQSGIAGAIVSVATIVNAVLSPIVGYVSDNSAAKWGKRRTYMFWGGIGCVIALPLMLIPVPLSDNVKIAFYGFAIMLYWTAFAIFYTPYLAYGADISSGYNERSNLRTWVTIFSNTGAFAAYSGVMSIVALLMELGLTEHVSYFCAITLISTISLVCLIIGMEKTRGHDEVTSKEERGKLEIGKFVKGLLTSYADVLRLKCMRIIILVILFSMIGYMVEAYCEMFMLTENCGLSAGAISIYFLIIAGVNLVRPIPTKWFCNWFGKRGGFVLCVIIYIVSAIFYAVHGVNNFTDAIIRGLLMGFILSGYWQIIPAIVYDITDVDYYFTRKQREGTIVSFQALVESLGIAIAASVSGLFLAYFGVNEAAAEAGEAISERALDGILYLCTIIPGVFFAIAAVLVLIFPINKKRHDRVREALARGIHADDNDPEYEDLKVLN